MSHTLRTVLFLMPVQMFVSGLLLWLGFRALRARTFGVQVFLAAISAIWVWAQLKHGYVI